MNIIIITILIPLLSLIKLSRQTTYFEENDDYTNVDFSDYAAPSSQAKIKSSGTIGTPTYPTNKIPEKGNGMNNNAPGYSHNAVTTEQRRPPSEKCSKMGLEVVKFLNELRKEYKLNTLAADDDLCFVNKMHVLANKNRHKGDGGMGMLTHDWDPPPKYPAPPIKWEKMKWDLDIPRKLIGYNGDAGENAAQGYRSAKEVIEGWKKSEGHLALMVNTGPWKDSKWKGAGCDCDMSETYLCYLLIGDAEVSNSAETGNETGGSGSGTAGSGSGTSDSKTSGSGSGNSAPGNEGSEGTSTEGSGNEGSANEGPGLGTAGSGTSEPEPSGSGTSEPEPFGSGFGAKWSRIPGTKWFPVGSANEGPGLGTAGSRTSEPEPSGSGTSEPEPSGSGSGAKWSRIPGTKWFLVGPVSSKGLET